MTIKHTFVSAVTEQSDPTLIGPNEWNSEHSLAPGTILRKSRTAETFSNGTNTFELFNSRTLPASGLSNASALFAASPNSFTPSAVINPPYLIQSNNYFSMRIVYGAGLYVAYPWSAVSTSIYTSPDGINWITRTITSASFSDIVYGNNMFVGVCSGSQTAWYSYDGITWFSSSLPASTTWASVTYGNGVFVAVAGNGTPGTSAAISYDGVTWWSQTLPSSAAWSAVTYGGSVFVAVAGYSTAGTIAATSPDGITWTSRTLPTSATWMRVKWGGTQFVAIAGSPNNSGLSNAAATSSDGITWTARTLPFTQNWCELAYNGSVWCAVAGYSQGGAVGTTANYSTSTDGITWTSRTFPLTGVFGICNNGTNFVLSIGGAQRLGYYNAATPTITMAGENQSATSTDGVNWSYVSVPGTSNFQTIGGMSKNGNSAAYNGSVYVFVSAASNVVFYSSDGINWQASNMPAIAQWTAVAWNGTVFCAISGSTSFTSNVAATSTDGINWTARTLPSTSSWISIVWNGTVFCAVAWNGTVAATSSDGITWTGRTLPSSSMWGSLCWNGTVFCAVAWNTTAAATSPDGITWTARTMPVTGYWQSVMAGPTGLLLAIQGTTAGNTVAATSSDNGVTWTQRRIPISSSAGNTAFGGWNGSVFVISAGTSLATSSDGITWTQKYLPWYFVMAYGAFIVGTKVTIIFGSFSISTTDGTNYSVNSNPFAYNGWIAGAASNSGTLVFVPNFGSTAISSTDGITWTSRTLPSNSNWKSLAYGNGVFCAIACGGTVAATSSDGITWTARTLPNSLSWMKVIYANSLFVAIACGTNTYATSPDGITWTSRTLPISAYWIDITYGLGYFWAVAPNSAIYKSSDGINWSAVTAPYIGHWSSVTFTGLCVAAVCNKSGKTMLTYDGTTWRFGSNSLQGSGSTIQLGSINNAGCLYVGQNGYQSKFYYFTDPAANVAGVAVGNIGYCGFVYNYKLYVAGSNFIYAYPLVVDTTPPTGMIANGSDADYLVVA